MWLYQRNMQKILSWTKTVEVRVRYPNYKNLAPGPRLRVLEMTNALRGSCAVAESPTY